MLRFLSREGQKKLQQPVLVTLPPLEPDTPEPDMRSPTSSVHGSIYCAARHVYRCLDAVVCAEDTDRLMAALAELHELALATHSPEPDRQEIEAWRNEAAAKLEERRRLTEDAFRYPNLTEVENYIATGRVPGAQPQEAPRQIA